jgi:hypothetical protein
MQMFLRRPFNSHREQARSYSDFGQFQKVGFTSQPCGSELARDGVKQAER